jgi:dTDP-4-amino-4,6-dideoxygalactose transaminase
LIKDPIPLHWQPNLGLSHFKLPDTEKLAKEVISLPLYPELNDEEVQYVINCVKEFYTK